VKKGVIKMATLAIKGGPPVRTKPFPIFSTDRDIGVEEIVEVVRAVYSKRLGRNAGTYVRRFEEEFAKLYGVKYAIASTSGTVSIHVALGAINPEPGTEIITGAISDIGTIIPILLQNCIPVFADLDPDTYSLDPSSVEEKITEKTRVIIPVHLFGVADHLDELRDICDRRGLYLIEDCSQAHLATYRGKYAGTWGDLGCFSLQQSKQMTTGDGGMTITNDDKLGRRARLFMDKAWPRGGDDRGYLFLALNARMTEMQGAVGLAQLRKVKDMVERRRRVAKYVINQCKDLNGLFFQKVPEDSESSFWLIAFRVDKDTVGVDASTFNEALKAEGIPSGHGYIKRPLYMFPVLRDWKTYGNSGCPFTCPHARPQKQYVKGMCPTTEAILDNIITIFINESFTDEDAEDIARGIRKVYENINELV